MKISVVTICLNSENSIEQTIKSVVDQTYSNIDYIMVDGGSTDGTLSIIQKYSHRISKLISEPDSGIYNAMNKGVNIATGDYILFLNSDDYLLDNTIFEDVSKILNARPCIDFLYGNIQFRHHPIATKSTDTKKISSQTVTIQDRQDVLELLITSSLPHPASFARRSLFEKIGLFDEDYRIVSDFKWIVEMASDSNNTIAYYDRFISSFYMGGASGDMEKRLHEKFDVINNAAIFQTEYWLKKQIEIYQSLFIDPRGIWRIWRFPLGEHPTGMNSQLLEAKSRVETLQQTRDRMGQEMREIEAEVEGMKSSKFWKLRIFWFKLKEIFGKPKFHD